MIVNMEEQLERERKQIRLMSDDYMTLKRESENDRKFLEGELYN